MHVYHSLCFDPGLRLLRLDVAFHFTSTWYTFFSFSFSFFVLVKLIGRCDYVFIIPVVYVERFVSGWAFLLRTLVLKIILIVVQTDFLLQLDYGHICREEMAKDESI